MKTLVVEDDDVARTLLKAILTRRGHEVLAFEDAETAWEGSRDPDIHLALIDRHLPGKDGLALCRHIRQVRSPHDPVVLIMSQSRTLPDVQEMLQAGADDYLLKPLDATQVEVRLAVAAFQARERREHFDQLRLLNHVLRSLHDAADTDAALEAISATILRATGWRLGEVHAVIDGELHLVRRVQTGAGEDASAAGPAAPSLARTCKESRGVVWVRRFDEDAGAPGLEAGVALPVVCGERVENVLCFFMAGYHHEDDRWVEILEVLKLELQSLLSRKRAEAARQESEAALQRSEEQLRLARRMEVMGRLTSGVAHDFNNLLTGIFGYVDWMLEKAEASHPFHEGLAEIKGAAERAAALTGQLLIFSRKQVLRPAALDLNEIVDGLRRLLRHVVGAKVELRTNLTPHLPAVFVDRGQVEQVLMNLAVNARDAMPSGGLLSITTSAGGDVVHLHVQDTGHGMDAVTMTRIFEPFFTTKEQGKGTGLGLSTVHDIVRGAHGSISVRSEEGRGTGFHIELPAHEARILPPTATLHAMARLDGRRILVVEDEPLVRQLMCHTLRECGSAVVEARDGTEALGLVAGPAPFDLIVADVVTPGMGAHALLEELRRKDMETRLLFTSGYTDVDGRDLTPERYPFLQKPFTPSQLVEEVRATLEAPL